MKYLMKQVFFTHFPPKSDGLEIRAVLPSWAGSSSRLRYSIPCLEAKSIEFPCQLS